MKTLGNLEGFLELQVLLIYVIVYLKLFLLNCMQLVACLLHPYISTLVLYIDNGAAYTVNNTFL